MGIFSGATPDELLREAYDYAVKVEEEEWRWPFIGRILDEMYTDADSSDLDIINDYLDADESARACMDLLMVDLCGWTFGSIIKMVLGKPLN